MQLIQEREAGIVHGTDDLEALIAQRFGQINQGAARGRHRGGRGGHRGWGGHLNHGGWGDQEAEMGNDENEDDDDMQHDEASENGDGDDHGNEGQGGDLENDLEHHDVVGDRNPPQDEEHVEPENAPANDPMILTNEETNTDTDQHNENEIQNPNQEYDEPMVDVQPPSAQIGRAHV